jgi:hypothetical protein
LQTGCNVRQFAERVLNSREAPSHPLPDPLCFLPSSLLFIEIRKPFSEIFEIPHLADGKPLEQELFGSVQVPQFWARESESVAIRPADPAPSPPWIGFQPLAIKRLGLAGLAQLKR